MEKITGTISIIEDSIFIVTATDGTVYQLHPDNVEYLNHLSIKFDNIYARILNSHPMEFKIVSHKKLSGIVKYAIF